jgi:hypothetical protein
MNEPQMLFVCLSVLECDLGDKNLNQSSAFGSRLFKAELPELWQQ